MSHVVLAGMAHLGWRISDGFTYLSGAPASVAEMAQDVWACFSSYGLSVEQDRWTLLDCVSEGSKKN